MSNQTGILSGAEHDFFLTISGMSSNTPLTEMKARVFQGAGFGAVNKPLTQIEREWLQNYSGSSKYNEGDLWFEALASLGITPSVNITENKLKFYQSPIAQLQTAIRSLNPTSYYPLDEASGNALNRAPSTYGTLPGTVTNATQNQTGKVGKCYSFDGNGDGVTFTGLNPTTGSFTVGFLIKRNGNQDAADRLFDTMDGGPANGINFIFNAATTLRFELKNNTTSVVSITSNALTDLTWYWAIGTYEVNSAKFFINSDQVGVTDTDCTMTQSSAVPSLGKRAGGSANYFNGSIQHFFTCDKVITTTDILKLNRIAGLA